MTPRFAFSLVRRYVTAQPGIAETHPLRLKPLGSPGSMWVQIPPRALELQGFTTDTPLPILRDVRHIRSRSPPMRILSTSLVPSLQLTGISGFGGGGGRESAGEGLSRARWTGLRVPQHLRGHRTDPTARDQPSHLRPARRVGLTGRLSPALRGLLPVCDLWCQVQGSVRLSGLG